MKEQVKQNATLTATKNVKGQINLFLQVGDIDGVSVRVNDFGGTQKKRARLLTYKIYKSLEGK